MAYQSIKADGNIATNPSAPTPDISAVNIRSTLTVATLPTGPTRGMALYIVTDSLAPAVGAVVAAGGAATALVWYNGAAWTVIGI